MAGQEAPSASASRGRATMVRTQRVTILMNVPPCGVFAAIPQRPGRLATWRRYFTGAAPVKRARRPLRLALADIAVGHGGFALRRRNRHAVEKHSDLTSGAVLVVGPPLFVEHAKDVPFVVRAAADGSRCAQRVVFAEGRFAEAALNGLGEGRVRGDALVEIRIQLAHVVAAVEAEVACEVLRPREIGEVELAEAIGAFQ